MSFQLVENIPIDNNYLNIKRVNEVIIMEIDYQCFTTALETAFL
jgi:hypothetical protein